MRGSLNLHDGRGFLAKENLGMRESFSFKRVPTIRLVNSLSLYSNISHGTASDRLTHFVSRALSPTSVRFMLKPIIIS